MKIRTSIIGIIATLVLGLSLGFMSNPTPAEAITYSVTAPRVVCPGGGTPQCVSCTGSTCVWSCAGGKVCYTAGLSLCWTGSSCGGPQIFWSF